MKFIFNSNINYINNKSIKTGLINLNLEIQSNLVQFLLIQLGPGQTNHLQKIYCLGLFKTKKHKSKELRVLTDEMKTQSF